MCADVKQRKIDVISFTERAAFLSKKKRAFLSLVSGTLGALSFEPFNLLPLLWLSFPALFLLVQTAKRGREAFALGWLFAFGFLVPSLYWIAASLFVDIKAFGWALPFAIAGLPALFSFYYGLAAWASWRWGLKHADGVFFFALCWFLADMARAHLWTGFPWDIMGYVWGANLPIMQITSVMGVEGLTLVTLLLAFLPALYLIEKTRKKAPLCLLGGLFILGCFYGWGSWRLAQAPDDFVPNVKVRIVQPHMDQSTKWDPQHRATDLEDLVRLSFSSEGAATITHFIWPETATAYYLAEEPAIRAMIARAMPKGSFLLTGSVRRQFSDEGDLRYYNSLFAMDAEGRILAGYDKRHLVPFGEYMPLRGILPLKVISFLGKSFSSGDGARTVRVQGLPPFSGLICYEAIFSGDVLDRQDPPALMINMTNDAWYDGTIGPAQHFVIARARAIEEGLPMIRVANRGETAVIDAYGRIKAQVGANKAGFTDSEISLPVREPTPMSLWGSGIAWFFYLFCLLGVVFLRIRRKTICP